MDTLKLGQIIEPDRAVERDAIHMAIAPVTAGTPLIPGQHVGIKNGKAIVQTWKVF